MDDAEKRCHPGPESPQFMQEDLQMLAKYPIYGMVLNWIPYTYPVIAGFLGWWLLFTWYRKSSSGIVSVSLPKVQKDVCSGAGHDCRCVIPIDYCFIIARYSVMYMPLQQMTAEGDDLTLQDLA